MACAQPYKRHDVLFDALAARPGTRALCVVGYGELSDHLRRDAAARGLDVTFVGPPGVPHDEVNRLMNLARVGVVCGEADGAPAILTEYMLAGLPVLANDRLACGLHFIRPETGVAAPADAFAHELGKMLSDTARFAPREAVLARWAWPHTARRLAATVRGARLRKT